MNNTQENTIQPREKSENNNTNEEETSFIEFTGPCTLFISTNTNTIRKPLNQKIILPPINFKTLSELDLTHVYRNSTFRHNLLFDNNLRIRQKEYSNKNENRQYWEQLTAELISIKQNSKIIKRPKYGKLIAPLCLEFKKIICSLLPDDTANICEDSLDLYQLIITLSNNECWEKNNTNLLKFGCWLELILKNHCAPIRDSIIDEISFSFNNALNQKNNNIENSIQFLVNGIELLFKLLETMKIDLLNEQIRTLTPFLLTDLISFEKNYYHIRNKNPPIINFEDMNNNNTGNSIRLKNTKFQIVTNRILQRLSCKDTKIPFPSCLELDNSRLVKIKLQIRQMTCIAISRIFYLELLRKNNNNNRSSPNKISQQEFNNEIIGITRHNHTFYWTKNVPRVAIHLKERSNSDKDIKYIEHWLKRNFQPCSTMYQVFENRLLKLFENIILLNDDLNPVNKLCQGNNIFNYIEKNQFLKISNTLQTIINLHWMVYSDVYLGKEIFSDDTI